MKQAILTMTMIRSVVDDSALAMIPNELLFEIFSHLEPPDRITCDRSRTNTTITTTTTNTTTTNEKKCAMM